MQWAFYARHLDDVLYTPPPNPSPYLQLDALTKHADRWVLTSNADNLFVRTGFDPQHIWTRQGTYAHLQCLQPCTDTVWETKPYIDRILPHINLSTGELDDPSLVPQCPRCGGEAFLNVHGGPWFVEKPYEGQREGFTRWLGSAADKNLVLLDIGTGLSTPDVVRWPMEQLAANHPNAYLIRINEQYPEAHRPLDGRYAAIRGRIGAFLDAVT
jgi:NAD-dependent SIR2 family protein deacetylase